MRDWISGSSASSSSASSSAASSSAAAAAATEDTYVSPLSTSSLREDPAKSAARRDDREGAREAKRQECESLRREQALLSRSPLHLAAYESGSESSRILAIRHRLSELGC